MYFICVGRNIYNIWKHSLFSPGLPYRVVIPIEDMLVNNVK